MVKIQIQTKNGSLGAVVVALDDWLIWAVGDDLMLYQVSCECWPEWLGRQPEDMEDEHFKREVLSILKQPGYGAPWNTWEKSYDVLVRAECHSAGGTPIPDHVGPAFAAFVAREWRRYAEGIQKLAYAQTKLIKEYS